MNQDPASFSKLIIYICTRDPWGCKPVAPGLALPGRPQLFTVLFQEFILYGQGLLLDVLCNLSCQALFGSFCNCLLFFLAAARNKPSLFVFSLSSPSGMSWAMYLMKSAHS